MLTHFPGGIQTPFVSGIGPVYTTGNVFYVDSGHAQAGDDTTHGMSVGRPFATLDYAVGQCTANNGDVIYVMPGHAETIAAAAGVDFDVAGITVVGLGQGNSRPTFTFTTAAAADVDIDAADVRLVNLRFVCAIDQQVSMVDVNAARAVIERCEFTVSGAVQPLVCIDINGGSANACDGCQVLGCTMISTAAGANAGIELGEVANLVQLRDNLIYGDFADACIHNPTAKVLTHLLIVGNELVNLQSGDHAIELVSACTGLIARNLANSSLAVEATQTAIDRGAAHCVENYGHNAGGDDSGVLQPPAQST